MSESVSNFQYSFEAPSNIALIKYWGKKDRQIPLNPSISFTLKNSYSKMDLLLSKSSKFSLAVNLDGKENENFSKKLAPKLLALNDQFPWLQNYKITINTSNTFPHSAGIASSASSMCALAKCLLKANEDLTHKSYDQNKISMISRLLSGSACRSVDGPIMHWGLDTNQFATKFEDYHEIFKTFHDSILVVDETPKEISSSQGHALMNAHPYRESRVSLATDHMKLMLKALKNGDLDLFGHILEQEALGLHGLMMTSDPSYTLLKPKSLEIIASLKTYRKKRGFKCFFTLDAGPNIHLLYPKSEREKVLSFLDTLNINQIIEDKVSGYEQ